MWESPIKVVETALDCMTKEFEDSVMLEITKQYGVYVDKQELEKALVYDRKQYEKGYSDAKGEFIQELKSKIRNLYNEYYANPETIVGIALVERLIDESEG